MKKIDESNTNTKELVKKIDESNNNTKDLVKTIDKSNTNVAALVKQNQTIINAIIHGNSKSLNPNENLKAKIIHNSLFYNIIDLFTKLDEFIIN